VLVQKFFLQLFGIVYFPHRANGKSPQMRVHQNGLRLGIAYHTNPARALKRLYVALEFISKITVFQTVNGTLKAFLLRVKREACMCRPTGRVVRGSLSDVRDARGFPDVPHGSPPCPWTWSGHEIQRCVLSVMGNCNPSINRRQTWGRRRLLRRSGDGP